MGRLLRLAAVAALGGLASAGVVGCSRGGGEASSSFPGVVIPSPSVSVSPTPTVLSDDELLALIPEEARTEDFPGAVNFSRFFLREWGAMYVTQDTQLFEALSSPECTFCLSSLDEVRAMVAEGGVSTGGAVTFVDTDARGGREDSGNMNVTLDITVAASTITDASGGVVTAYGDEALTAAILLRYEQDHWTVVDVGSEPR